MFFEENGSHAYFVRWFLYPKNSIWRPKTGSSFIIAPVAVFEGYLSRLLCFPGRQIECLYCYLDHNSSWCYISRWRRKSITTILNPRLAICKRSKRYVQNWKYFRFVVAILKDSFAVDSNSIYLASVSSIFPKHTITVLHRCDVSNICQTETSSTFCLPYLFLVWWRHLAMWILLPLKKSSLKT